MLITCEDCHTRFQLDDRYMKEEGVKVKCSKCGKVFKAYAPSSIGVSGVDSMGMDVFDESPETTETGGLDFSEMEALLSSDDDFNIDMGSNGNSEVKDSGFGLDETNELDLSDMDKIFEDDEFAEEDNLVAEAPEELDLELDLVQETVPSLGSTGSESEEIEELDFLETDEGSVEAVSSVEEIEELDLELDQEKDTPVPALDEEGDLALDDESLHPGTDTGASSPETVEELEFSVNDMEEMFADNQLKSADAANDMDEEFSFDLAEDIEMDEISAETPAEDIESDELDLEDMGPEEIEAEEAEDEFEELGLTDLEEMFTLEDGSEEEGASELDVEMDSDFALPDDADEIESDAEEISEFDFEMDDGAEPEAEPEGESDEFEEFGLTDLEEMFNLEAEQKPEPPEKIEEESDGIDFSDEDFDDGDHEELEFKLDEAIAVLDGSSQEEVGVEFEEYEELDLSELDEMFDKEEVVIQKENSLKEELGELDFGIDTLPEPETDTGEQAAEEDLGMADTSELDFSDIGEMLESEEELDLPDTSGIVEDESELDFEPEIPPLPEEEPGLDFGPETQTLVGDEPEETTGLAETVTPDAEKEDFDLSDESFDLSDDDLDLSEMEKMLQEADSLEEESAPAEATPPGPPPLPEPEEDEAEEEPIEAQEDLDFGVDEDDAQDDFFQTEETQDIELEFGVEEEGEEEEEEPPPITPPEIKEKAKIEEDDIEATYDMGLQLDEIRKKQAAEKLKGVKVDEKTLTEGKTKPSKKAKPIPFEKKKKGSPILVALLIIILVIGVPVALTNMGVQIPFVSDFISSLDIKIPFADKIQQANIPFISDLVKSGEQDVQGIRNITILEPSLNGYYVENTSEGDIFVISGQVRNDYDQVRSFISVKGQIYSKGRAHIETKTVYAGNVLSDPEVSSLNAAAIDKRLKNKYGDNRSNFNLKKGKTIPFMIVFTKIPEGLEGYDVEVVGSTASQAKSGEK